MIEPLAILTSVPFGPALVAGLWLIGFLLGYVGSGLYFVFHSDEGTASGRAERAPVWIGIVTGVGLVLAAAGMLSVS